ncbi:MAG: pitrilysin family protein [Myxococcota bacterium]|jgi:zinc protease|nr:pitrilysin family protein [Myxococcota bacterium]
MMPGARDRSSWRQLVPLLLLVLLLPSLSVEAATSLPVQKRVLRNGLTVMVLPDSSIPSCSLFTFFKVGSRNEEQGRTGLAHFFEHMMFNGSRKFGPGAFDRVMESAGGSNNAFTTNDITAYMDWFPVSALDTILDLESDRMAYLLISPEKVESERDVVLQERRLRVDGDPDGSLEEIFFGAAYLAHPYRWPVIGWESDIRSWTQQDLVNFHRVYYAPNNAVMVLVGAVNPEHAFARIEAFYGAIPPGPPPQPVRTVEPVQRGERRVELRMFAQLPALRIGYHVPASADAQAATMKIVETILMAGQSSRLYRRLVDQDQSALTVGGGYGEWNFDPTLFEVDVKLRAGVTTTQVERAVYEELERLARQAPPDKEVRKAKNQVLTNLYREQKTLDGKAQLLGIFEVFHGGADKLEQWDELIEQVTPEQIRQFAQRFLIPANRTVAVLVPTAEEAAGAGIPDVESAAGGKR